MAKKRQFLIKPVLIVTATSSDNALKAAEAKLTQRFNEWFVEEGGQLLYWNINEVVDLEAQRREFHSPSHMFGWDLCKYNENCGFCEEQVRRERPR